MELGEFLKEDMENELALVEFYMGYAKRVNNPKARLLFFRMMEESMGHYSQFKAMYRKKAIGMAAAESDFNEIELTSLIERGMEEERGSRERYQKQLESIDDAEAVALLTKIIADEERHERMLSEAYSQISQKVA